MALKNVSLFGFRSFRSFRLPRTIFTRTTNWTTSSIEKAKLLDKFESFLPSVYLIESSDIVTGYSSINVEILGTVTKFYKFIEGTKIVLLVKTLNDFGETVIHKLKGLPEGPSKQVIEKLQPGNLILIHGNIVQNRTVKKEGEEKFFTYSSPISIFSVNLINRLSVNISNSFTYAMVTGVVINKYSEIVKPGSRYVGQIDILTWREIQNEKATVQTNRIMISKETLRCFPFLPEIEKGEKLFINGPLDYIQQPSLRGLLLVVTAKQVIQMKNVGKREFEQEQQID